MKKSILLLFAALLPLMTNAHDFEVDGIYYNITSEADKQAEVTYEGDSYGGHYDYGDYFISITVPATVTHNGVEYSVTSIGESAFEYCRSLTAITIPEGVTSIESGAFRYCSSLTSITIPEGVTSIGDETFSGCTSLAAITLPEGVTSIGYAAFSGCSSLTAIVVEEGNTIYDSRDGCNAIIETASNVLILGCSATIIPEGVTSIGDYAFLGCSSLTAINIPEGVTSIGEYAFSSCSSLTAITIPEGVTSIGIWAFTSCSSLTAINIPENSQLTSIEWSAFSGCSSLTDITIPEGVTSIGQQAFQDCSSLTDITIPEGVTSIGIWAFSNCSSLTAITIPESVVGIYGEAFANCPELLDVYCYAESVPSTEAGAFDGSNPEYATLHVPAGAINDYKTTAPWSSFGTIKTIENVTLEKCATPVISYVDGKVIFACDTDGAIVKSSVKEDIEGNYDDMAFDLIPTYTLTAYATKANYEKSDVATLTLCWIPCDEKHEEDNGILTIPSTPVLISARDGVLTLSGLAEGTEVTLYTTDGAKVAQQQSSAGEATFTVDTNQVYLVHIGDKVVKIGM